MTGILVLRRAFRVRYFVSGATGFIGRHLVRQLVEGGCQVVAAVRDPSRAKELVALGVDVRQGDVTEKESLREPMRGADGVFHLAGWYQVGARDKSPAEPVNVHGTRNLLELMQELQIPKGVYPSTLAVYGDTGGRVVDESYPPGETWFSEYDRTKRAAHFEVAEPMIAEGLPLVIVMPGLVYGPDDHSLVGVTMRELLRRRLPALPEGSAFCWAHVEDIARAHLQAMEKGEPGETYIIGGPAHSLVEVAEKVAQVSGVPLPRSRPGPGLMKIVAALMGIVEALGVSLPTLYSPETLRYQAGVTMLGSYEKAQRGLGYAPRSLDEALPEVVRYEMAGLGLQPPGI